jgi:hypothetical protein
MTKALIYSKTITKKDQGLPENDVENAEKRRSRNLKQISFQIVCLN